MFVVVSHYRRNVPAFGETRYPTSPNTLTYDPRNQSQPEEYNNDYLLADIVNYICIKAKDLNKVWYLYACIQQDSVPLLQRAAGSIVRVLTQLHEKAPDSI